jgi:hypothetical protein
MNPVDQARHTSFEETLLSARRTMLLSEILKLALDSFRAAKLRFVLTALGMVIGTASVILVVTIGMTGRQYVLELIQKFGTNSVEVEYAGGGATNAERVRYTDYLTRDDEKAVDAQVPGVMYSSPVMDMHDRISFGNICSSTISSSQRDASSTIPTNQPTKSARWSANSSPRNGMAVRIHPLAEPSRSAAFRLPSSVSSR